MPPAPRWGGRQDEKETNTKNIQSCASIEWSDYPDYGPALSGEDEKNEGTTTNSAQNSENVFWATLERPDHPDQPRH